MAATRIVNSASRTKRRSQKSAKSSINLYELEYRINGHAWILTLLADSATAAKRQAAAYTWCLQKDISIIGKRKVNEQGVVYASRKEHYIRAT